MNYALEVMTALIGETDLGLMKTLSSQFPLIRQVKCETQQEAVACVQPYLNWHLIAFDSEFNVLLSREASNLNATPLHDLVILVGLTARAWTNEQQRFD